MHLHCHIVLYTDELVVLLEEKQGVLFTIMLHEMGYLSTNTVWKMVFRLAVFTDAMKGFLSILEEGEDDNTFLLKCLNSHDSTMERVKALDLEVQN